MSLFVAIDKNNIETVKQILKENPNTINETNQTGNTALIMAAEKGHKEIVQLLLDKGADLYKVDENSDTALMIAAKKGHKEIVEMIFKKIYGDITIQFTKEIRDKVKQFLIKEVNTKNYPVMDSNLYSRKDLSKMTEEKWNLYFAFFEDLYQYIMKFHILKHPSELINPVKTTPTKRQRTTHDYAKMQKRVSPVKSVKPAKEGKPGQVYRASSKEYYDRGTKTFIPYPGKSQPIWFALDENVARKYRDKDEDKNIMIGYIIKDNTSDSNLIKRKRGGTPYIQTQPKSMEEQNMEEQNMEEQNMEIENNDKKDLRLMNLDGEKLEECLDRNVYELNVELMNKLYTIVSIHLDLKDQNLDLKDQKFLAAYGLSDNDNGDDYNRLRHSFYEIDRILTIEFMIIFQILNEYIFNQQKDKDPLFILGYYHSNASTSTDTCKYFGAEVTINADLFQKIRIFDSTVDLMHYGPKKPFKKTAGKPPRNKYRFTRKKNEKHKHKRTIRKNPIKKKRTTRKQ